MSDWDWTPETRGRLETFLEAHGLTSGEVDIRPIGDGHSNLTYLVGDHSGRSVVVRRPPPPPTPPGAHDMMREARLVGALSTTAVPVAGLLATANAGSVLDVDFYVMSFVDGAVVTTRTPDELADSVTRRALGHSLVDTLAALHAVDWRAVGLADLGRPEGFNSRHLARMARLIADDEGRLPAPFADLEAWLRANAPAESGATIVHNDYRIGNLVLSRSEPGTVAAVLDWELATLGDPLFDLGYFLCSVPEQPEDGDLDRLTPTERFGAALLEDGFPGRTELAERYARRSGADLSNLPWYMTLAQWKLAVLYEYGRRRAELGVGDPYYADPSGVQAFLAAARLATTAATPRPGTMETR